MQYVLIIFLSVIGAVTFGIVHDMFTANMCVEYFTVAHPKIIDSENPYTLALLWGIIATWWVGLPLGLALSFSARQGDRPKVSAIAIIRPLLILLGAMLLWALIAWTTGYGFTKLGLIKLYPPWTEDIPDSKHALFIGNVWAHLSSYFFGILGGILLCIYVSKTRNRRKG